MFKRVLADHHGDIAGVISTPYDHQAMNENHLPADGFWNEVRQLCTANGIVLILDDVRCGFRLDLRGSDYHYGFRADLICFCKALANGYNISALCGGRIAPTGDQLGFRDGQLLVIGGTNRRCHSLH